MMDDTATHKISRRQRFALGETVWHRADASSTGIVSGLVVRGPVMSYLVRFGATEDEREYQAYELTDERKNAFVGEESSIAP